MPGHITSRKSSGDILHEDLEIWPRLLHSNLTKVELGDDKSIVDAHHQAVKADRSPPLPGPVVDQIVLHHLVAEVNSLYELL